MSTTKAPKYTAEEKVMMNTILSENGMMANVVDIDKESDTEDGDEESSARGSDAKMLPGGDGSDIYTNSSRGGGRQGANGTVEPFVRLKTNASKGFLKPLRSDLPAGKFNKIDFGNSDGEETPAGGLAEGENYAGLFTGAPGAEGKATGLGRFTGKTYANPNTNLLHASILGEYLSYDRHGAPLNGNLNTLTGASLQLAELERAMSVMSNENPLEIEHVADSEYYLPVQDGEKSEEAPLTLHDSIQTIQSRADLLTDVLIQPHIDLISQLFKIDHTTPFFQEVISKKDELDDTYLQNFDIQGRHFFYILGNLISKKQQKKKPALAIYEYFEQDNCKPTESPLRKVQQIALNNKFLRAHQYHSKLVQIRDNKLIYVKINNDEANKTIDLTVCSYDVVADVERTLRAERQAMKSGEDGVDPQFGAFVVFAANGFDEQHCVMDETEFIQNQFLAVAYSRPGTLIYSIRKLSDFESSLHVGEIRLGSRKAHSRVQLDLLFMKPQEHQISNLEADIIMVQSRDSLGNVEHKKQLQVKNEWNAASISEFSKYLQVEAAETFLENTLYKSYSVYQTTKSNSQKLRKEGLIQYTANNPRQQSYFPKLCEHVLGVGAAVAADHQQISLSHDECSGQYTFICTMFNNLFVRQVQDAAVEFQQDFDISLLHPFTSAAYFTQYGRQIDPQFCNVFHKQVEDNMVVVYFDHDRKLFKNKAEARVFQEAVANSEMYDIDHTKQGDPKEFNVKRIQQRWQDRPFEARMHRDEHQKVFFEIFDAGNDKSVKKFLLHSQLPSDQTDYKQYQNFCESSQIYRKEKVKNRHFQNFQWASIHPSKLLVEIQEFEVSWTPLKQSGVEVYLISEKLLLLKPGREPLSSMFYPIYSKEDKIIGTQFLPVEQGQEDLDESEKKACTFLQIYNLAPQDYQLKTELINAGYRQIIDLKNLQRDVLVLSACLSDRLRQNQSTITDEQRIALLNSQLRALLNTVPNRVKNVFLSPHHYHLFQPLAALRGLSFGDLLLRQPKVLQQKMNEQLRSTQIQNLSFGQVLEHDNPVLASILREEGFLQEPNEVIQDMLYSNCIEKCFLFKVHQLASARVLLESQLAFPQSFHRQTVIMSVSQHIIDNIDQFHVFGQFLTDFPDGVETSVEQTNQCVGYHLKDVHLPKFAHHDRSLVQCGSEFKSLVSFNARSGHIQGIIESIGDENKIQSWVKVDHFVLDFSPLILNSNLHSWRNQKPPRIFTEFELSEYLLSITRKYTSDMENFTGILNVIEAMYDKTRLVYSRLFAFFVVFFFIPFLAQIFLIGNSALGVLACNGSCLFCSFVFFVIELIQLRESGRRKYWLSLYNRFEFSLFPLHALYFAARYLYPESMLPQDLKPGDSSAPPLYIISNISLLTSIVLFWSVVKVLFFLRVYDKFALILSLITQCFRDVSFFSMFLFFWVFIFGCWYQILGVEARTEDFPMINKFLVFFLENFKNAVANLGSPELGFWEKQTENPAVSSVMVYICWIIWMLNQFFILVILLNFLIAIICQSYEEVLSKQIVTKYTRKCELNRECRLLLRTLGGLQRFESFVLTANVFASLDLQEWQGYVQTIRSFVSAQNKQVREQVHQEIKGIHTQIEQFESNVQTELNTEMQKTKSRINNVITQMTTIQKIRRTIPKLLEQPKGGADGEDLAVKASQAPKSKVQDIANIDAKSGFAVSQSNFAPNETIRSQSQQFEGGQTETKAPAQLLTVQDVEARLKVGMEEHIGAIKKDAFAIVAEIKSAIKASLSTIKEGVKHHNKQFKEVEEEPEEQLCATTNPEDEKIIKALDAKLDGMIRNHSLQVEVAEMNKKTQEQASENTRQIMAEIHESMGSVKTSQEQSTSKLKNTLKTLQNQMDKIQLLTKKLKK